MSEPQPQPQQSAPLPGWLGSAVQVTTQLGFPAVVAAVLLYFVLTRVGGTLDMIQKSEEDRIRIISAMQDTLIAALDRQTASFQKAIGENIAANREIAARMEMVARMEKERTRHPPRDEP